MVFSSAQRLFVSDSISQIYCETPHPPPLYLQEVRGDLLKKLKDFFFLNKNVEGRKYYSTTLLKIL